MELGRDEAKLNIGSGKKVLPGFINLDARPFDGVYCASDARHIPYPSKTFTLLYSSHVLEHFGRHEVLPVLKEWVRVLKPGGLLRLAVPSFNAALTWYDKTGNLEDILFVFCGGQDDLYDYHKCVFDKKSLTKLMEEAGLVDVVEWDWRRTEHADYDDFSHAYLPHMDFENGTLMSLNLEGRKPC